MPTVRSVKIVQASFCKGICSERVDCIYIFIFTLLTTCGFIWDTKRHSKILWDLMKMLYIIVWPLVDNWLMSPPCVELFNWCDGWFTTGFSDTPIINCSVPSLESQGTTMDWLLRRGTISSQNPGTWQPFDVLLVARPLLTCGNHQASPLRMPSSVPGFTAMSPGMRW